MEQLRKTLLDFADHLNTYKGFEEVRFDFMVVDYLDKLSKSHIPVVGGPGSDVRSEGEQLGNEAEEKCVCGAFDEGYKRGYTDATSEAIEEIHKNYKPRA